MNKSRQNNLVWRSKFTQKHKHLKQIGQGIHILDKITFWLDDNIDFLFKKYKSSASPLQLSKKKTLGGFDNHEEKEKQIFMNLLISKAEDVLLRKRQRARKKKVNFIKDIIDPRQDVIYEIKS